MKYIFDKIRAKRKKGFTLLEQLVVVLILAVLTAVAIPTYNKVMRGSRVADGINMLDVLASAQNRYYVQNGTYASNLNDLNTPIKNSNYASGNKIITTNFAYQKDDGVSCIRATSRQGIEYTLAKNYKTNSKIKCYGSGCNHISSYVTKVDDEDLLCSDDGNSGCLLTEEHCASLGMILEGCDCVLPPTPPTPPPATCSDDDDPIIVETEEMCKKATCGHVYKTKVCTGGEWVIDESAKTCSNDWLYAKCSPNEPNLEDCNCDSGIQDITCTHNDTTYQVGDAYATNTYENDDGTCMKEMADEKCYVKHLFKKCSDAGTWQDDYQCEDKATYCDTQGLVLSGSGCECEEPNPEVTCEYNTINYHPGDALDEGLVDDGTCPNDILGSQEKQKCFVSHITRICTNSGEWDINSECEDKSEYCEEQGLVLGESCKCVEKPSGICKYNDNIYTVGQTVNTGYVDDGKCSKDISGELSGAKCKIKRTYQTCQSGGSWEEGYECVNKSEYCESKGLILNESDCTCIEKDENACEYNSTEYTVGTIITTGYVDDGTCGSGDKDCLIKRNYKTCIEGGIWKDNYDCVNKSEYCESQGLVLGAKCTCTTSSCSEANKPSCDGIVTGGADPCGSSPKGSSTSGETGIGSLIYTPCNFLCGYTQDVAVCNESTGTWNKTCESKVKTYDPGSPKTQPCRGSGSSGSQCGVKNLESVSCTLAKPYQSLNFNVIENYGECVLPEIEGACWEGQVQSCTVNDTSGIKTCTGCQWSACIPNTCPESTKPSCDGKFVDVADPCGSSPKGSSPSGGGDPSVYVPCKLLCGYTKRVAVCNQETKQWNPDCIQELQTVNPNVTPKTRSCQGQGTSGSTCGTQSLESVYCTLTSSNPVNFNATGNYGECALPANDETACWEGQQETKVVNGLTYTRTCTGCHWGEWIGQCAETPNPSGSNIRACHTKNGVTNNDLYCGTQTATAKCDETTNYKWVWDFSNAACEQIQEMSEVECPSDNVCGRRIRIGAACTLQHDYSSNTDHYMFDPNTGSWGDCYPKAGSNCWKNSSLPSGVFCVNTSSGCKKARCTGNSVYNSGVNECLISQPLNTGIAFYYGASTTNSSYAGTYGYCSDGNAYIKTTCPTQIGCGSSANTSYTPDPVIAVADPTNCSTLTNTTAKYVQRRESTKCTDQKYGGQKGNITVYKCVQGTKEFVD